MKLRITFIIVICIVAIMGEDTCRADSILFDESRLPLSWNIQKVIDVPQSDLPQSSVRLGGKIIDLKNYILDAGGIKLQINILQCNTEEDAKKVYVQLLSLRQNRMFCQIQSKSVVEYICQNIQVIKKAHDILGLVDKTSVRWKVHLHIAPIKKAEYMKWNELFNMLANYQRNPNDEELRKKIKEISKSFVFAESFTLRTVRNSYGIPEYTFSESPTQIENEGDITKYYFENSSRILDIPSIYIDGIIPVKAFETYQPLKPINTVGLTNSTTYWPVTDKDIITLVENIITPDMPSKQKAEVFLAWVNRNIRFSGEIVGSRYGVKQVLKQGYGHCWDKNDVFITFCRTAGIPARQIAGWLNGVSGHIWTEVYITGEGWVSVDPAASWLGTSDDYIPFFISEDGTISFVYRDFPTISK